jgi:hypothetical protein
MSDFAIALAGGSIGTALATALALGSRALRVPREVRENDVAAAERNESLETWVADRHHWLSQELRGIRNKKAAQGQQYAGSLGNALAHAKGEALHLYRDEERLARRDIALITVREGWMHASWRKRRKLAAPSLTAAVSVQPVLDTWRRAVMEAPGSNPLPVVDATKRTLAETRANLTATSP